MTNNENISLTELIITGSVLNAYQSALILRQLQGLSEPDEKTRELILEDMFHMFAYVRNKFEKGPAKNLIPKV